MEPGRYYYEGTAVLKEYQLTSVTSMFKVKGWQEPVCSQ